MAPAQDKLPKSAEKYFNGNISHVWGTEVDAVVWPDENLPEIAIIGRSNVGKSSLINALFKRHKLARTSSTPGATRAVHFYEVPRALRVVDLPGYGYAKLSKTQSVQLSELIWQYFTGRRALKAILLLIDGRHGLKKGDVEMVQSLAEAGVGVWLVMTKSDKVRAGDAAKQKIAAELQQSLGVIPFVSPEISWVSAEKGDGLNKLRLFILKQCGVYG